MEPEFKQIDNENIVLSLEPATFRLGKLLPNIIAYFTSYQRLQELSASIASGNLGRFSLDTNVFSNGVDAELLEPGSDSWVKGKVRLKVVMEFCPDPPPEPEATDPNISPLDEIRQMPVD